MANTAQLELPLLAPSQAQKHVTVNEALVRLDALANLQVISCDIAVPPASGLDGESYVVPAGASGEWEDRADEIAIWSNGGWIYVQPSAGWRAWDMARFCSVVYTGQSWIHRADVATSGGAATLGSIIEFDHAMSGGATNLTSQMIPAHALVIGVSGRVIEAITGTGATSWRLGVAGSDNRYGSGLGLGLGSYVAGLTGTPLTYYTETALLLSAEGGAFTSGAVRIAIHYLQIAPPAAL